MIRTLVEAKHAETGYLARVVSGEGGRYAFLGLPLGGPYTVVARRLGFRPLSRTGITLTIGARAVVDFTLESVATQLSGVAVRADASVGRESRTGGSTRVSRVEIEAFPVLDRNFSALAALDPRAGAQLSLGGQRWTSTDIRIDGVQARNMLRAGESNGGPSAISLEAVREFEVNVDVFDAAQGRQGGGQIAAATRFGTNRREGLGFSVFRNERLSAATDFQGRERAARRAHFLQSGISLGGPIVRDRAHYFVVYERQDSAEPLVSGDVGTTQAEIAQSINRDSLARVLDVLGRLYGTGDVNRQLGRLDRRPLAQSLFVRADWQVSPEQRLTLRGTLSSWNSPLSGGVDQSITLREARADFRSREAQLLASLASRVGASAHNQLQLAFGHSRRTLEPESPGIPRGFVQVRSLLPDGSTGNATVQFGGNRLAPDSSREWQVQLTDRFSAQRGALLVSLGTDLTLTGARTLIAESQSGLFVFPSIAALETRRPNRFARTVPLGTGSLATQQHVLEVGAYAQVEWEANRRVTLTAGLRWDASAFLTAPSTHLALDQAFGVHTDRAPHDWLQLQPRAQLLWLVDESRRNVVRLGAGLFTAQLPYYAQHNQLFYTGTSVADIDIRGSTVPTPDYAAYREDPSTVPGLAPGSRASAPYANVVGDFRAPRTAKFTLAWSHVAGGGLTTTLGAHLGRTFNAYHYVDLNLPNTAAFRIDNEGGRGVFVPAATIPTATGVTDIRNASRDSSFARVVSLQSGARGNSVAFTGGAAYAPRRSARATVAYAWTRARDNSTYGCCLARTATTFTPIVDDPRKLDQAWGASDLDTRHRIVGTLELRLPGRVDVSARYIGASGRPFTLVVDGDVNGDEANGNDRAFLFDPDDPGTSPQVAASMRRMLANPRNVARHYMRSHLGEIASRNGLYTPWTHRVDARVRRRVALGAGNVEVVLDVLNVGNLINPEWGAQYFLPTGISSQNPVVNRVPLLRIVGFDHAAQRYVYSVNESAGVLPKGGEPYQLQLGLRVGF